MPPAVSLPLALVFWFLFRGLIGARYEGVFAGFLIGYVLYDTIHYATHHWRMDSRLGRFLKEYHLKHHYQDDDLSYGVSSPLWDYVFRTTARAPSGKAEGKVGGSNGPSRSTARLLQPALSRAPERPPCSPPPSRPSPPSCSLAERWQRTQSLKLPIPSSRCLAAIRASLCSWHP